MFLSYLRQNFARNIVRMDTVHMVKNVSSFMISVRQLQKLGLKLSNKSQKINSSLRVLSYLLNKIKFLIQFLNLIKSLHQLLLKKYQQQIQSQSAKLPRFLFQILQWSVFNLLYILIRKLVPLETNLQILLFNLKSQIFQRLWYIT